MTAPISHCRSCGAEIRWLIMRPSGKRMPVNAKPEKRITLDEFDAAIGEMVDTYVSHFSTCPQADEHRKAKP